MNTTSAVRQGCRRESGCGGAVAYPPTGLRRTYPGRPSPNVNCDDLRVNDDCPGNVHFQ
jgi:hypothetical protein